MDSVKEVVEQLLKQREWMTFSELLKNVNFPAHEVNRALIELMKENKVGRKGKFFYYQH